MINNYPLFLLPAAEDDLIKSVGTSSLNICVTLLSSDLFSPNFTLYINAAKIAASSLVH